MTNTITINNSSLLIKEIQGQRVVTFKDIDELHQRPDGTAKRNFNSNMSHFELGSDYFQITRKEFGTNFVPNEPIKGNPQLTVILLTEFGYLMLVKAFTDDLAWKVQRELVKNYFKAKPQTAEIKPASPNTTTLDRTMQALQQTQQTLIDCSIEHTTVLHDHEARIAQHEESTSTLTQEIKELKETSRIIVPDVTDRRFHGDEDTLSDNEYEAQCASDLPTKEFAYWIHDMINKIASKEKLGIGCGNIWRMSYKGLQIPNGKQVSCLTELLDECYISFRYIYALRLTTMLYGD